MHRSLYACKAIVMMGLLLIGYRNVRADRNPDQGKVWEVTDFSFESRKLIDAPYEVIIGCVFTASDGQSIDVAGFFNGGKEWIVRFTPPQSGDWTYVSYSSLAELIGKTGKLSVSPPAAGRHGGIRIDPKNPKHFVYADGSPYPLLAYEVDWLYALDYGDPDLPKTRTLVETIRQNGFNQVIMNVYAHDVRWEKDENLQPQHEYGARQDIFPFAGSNQSPDHSTLNPVFFQHLDRVIRLLDEQGIVAHLMIYVWNKEVNWPEANSPADNRYFDYVVKRYQAFPNILWDISKEALGYGHDDMGYISNRIRRLRRLDAYQGLVTVHDYRYCSNFPEMVDIISIQTWVSNLYDAMLQVHNQYPKKPVLNIEHGGYEACEYQVFQGNYDDPEVCLRRNYLCAFAGTYTAYYWQGTSWNVMIHDPFAPEVKVKPKLAYYRLLREFMEKYPFQHLKPTKGAGAGGYCLSNGKDQFLYWVPKDHIGVPITIKKQNGKKVRYHWLNPLTGETTVIQYRDWSGWFRLEPEFKNIDNILILELI